MRSKVKIATALGLAATAAVVVGALAAVSGNAAAGQTLQVRELNSNVTSIDVGKKGPSQGDSLAWNDPLKTQRQARSSATSTAPALSSTSRSSSTTAATSTSSSLTAPSGPRGMISLKGAPEPPGQITTGSGAYANARGFTTGKPVGATATDWTIRLTS